MSKSSNMLRTRRKDNNVKPNRRLDRKSSRGMLFENEDLRLKTININAEVERGQSDIKKLKRENDQLRREIWYLRDEYDKLDKMLREKESQESSTSTTCTSESESCSSCTEESEAVETSQNIENVQITNLKKLNDEFEQLSVVPEENSTENSEKNSIQTPARPGNCDDFNLEKDVIQPDQSYPVHENFTILPQARSPKHFFSPIKINKAGEDYVNNQFLGLEAHPEERRYYENLTVPNLNVHDEPSTNYYPSLELPSLHKTTTDVMVKTDNKHFDTIQSRSSFSNGGNLEELLNDIETISHDILKISNSQNFNLNADKNEIPPDMPYKSELNVVLMPSPMKLIGVEKYKQIQKSCESLNARSVENLKIIPEVITPNVIIGPEHFYRTNSHAPLEPYQSFVPVPPNCPSPGNTHPECLQRQNILNEQINPFFFGNIRHPCDSVEPSFTRYNRDVEAPEVEVDRSKHKDPEIYNSKTNLLDNAMSSDHMSSENEENLKFKTCRNNNEHQIEDDNVETDKVEAPKSPKSGIKNKVSIHFKGKKDKKPDDKNKKRSIFDLKKTSSVEPTSTDSKTSTSDNKNSSSASDHKPKSNYDIKTSESAKALDGKSRKSSSASPERKHNHKESKKVHKKHKKSERSKIRRNSNVDRVHRERSYSICTDRSNILEHRVGPYSIYDGFTTSDRERTNSLSSCDTIKGRKLSNITHFPATGKIPWCGCWGNGCL